MKKILTNIVASFLAGLFIGLGGIGFILAKTYASSGMFLGAAIFPIGLFLICTFKLNLYTGKIGFIFEEIKERGILFYIVMLLSNFLGILAIGLLFRAFSINDSNIISVIENVSNAKIANDPFIFFGKSVLCGILVYIAVYLYKQTDNGFLKALYVFLPIFMFVLFGFDHCIADFFYFTANLEFSLKMWGMLAICVVGNSIGSIIFNAAIKFIN